MLSKKIIMLSAVSISAGSVIVSLASNSLFNFVDEDSKIDGSYSWSPRYIEGVTEVVGVNDMTSDDMLISAWYYNTTSGSYSSYSTNYYIGVNLLDDANFGDMGVRYNNVGEYNGVVVDMEWIFEGASSINTDNHPSFLGTNTGVNRYAHPVIIFRKDKIFMRVLSYSCFNPVIRCTFYEHGTNKTMDVDGHILFCDLDASERMYFSNDVSEVLLKEYTTAYEFDYMSKSYIGHETSSISDSWSSLNDTDKEGWVCVNFDNTSEFLFSFSSSEPNYSNLTTLTRTGGRDLYSYGDAFSEYTTPGIHKEGLKLLDKLVTSQLRM